MAWLSTNIVANYWIRRLPPGAATCNQMQPSATKPLIYLRLLPGHAAPEFRVGFQKLEDE